MFFNCTFAHNATLESLCCVDHPWIDGPLLHVSSDNTTASCVSRNGTELNRCLAVEGVSPQFCRLREVDAGRTAMSSARPARRLGILSLVLIGLSLATGMLAATCRSFQRRLGAFNSPRITYSNSQRVSDVVACPGPAPCPVGVQRRPEWRMQWSFAAHAALSEEAMDEVDDSIYEASTAEAVRLLELYDEMYVPPGKEGYLQVRVELVSVPGRLRDCNDGKEYAGRAMFVNPAEFQLAVRTDVTDKDRRPLGEIL